MLKKIVRLFIATVFFMILTGCDRKSNNVFDRTLLPDRAGNTTAFNDKGVYYAKRGVIYMMDPLTGISTPLCSKVNCDHRGKSSSNPHPTCDAYFGEAAGYSAMVGDKLYCLLKVPDESRSFFTKEFYSADKNGTGRKLLFREDNIQFGTFGKYEDGYFLYGYKNTETPDGEELDKELIGMCIVNLETEELTHIRIEDKYSGNIYSMAICDGKLYYILSYMTVNLKEYDYDYLSDPEHQDIFSESNIYEVTNYNKSSTF